MRVVLWCPGSPASGAGRLLRTLALAEELAARGHQALLSADVGLPWAAELVKEAGLLVLASAASPDALAALAREQEADLVHLDAPGGEPWAAALRPHPPEVSWLDDLAAPDVAVDLTAGAAAPVRVSGAGFAPLRVAVREARQRRQWRAGGMSDRLRVLVNLGDEGSAEQLLPVVQALVHADAHTDILALGPSAAVGRRAESMSTRTVRVLATHHRADLPRLLADHDLVVTRPGRILWEVACIGTPSALVTLSPDDEQAAGGWVAAGAAVSLGRPGSTTANQLRALLRDGMRRADLSRTGQQLVDGEGATRVVQLMETVVSG